jgi:hypothetical protein
MTMALARPFYVNVITQNSVGGMTEGAHLVMLSPAPGPVGEAVARVQSIGSPESYNWLIDADGAVYELTGWDRAALDPGVYLVGMIDATETTPAQYQALNWLLGQLIRKKGVNEFQETLGEDFSWVLAGIH